MVCICCICCMEMRLQMDTEPTSSSLTVLVPETWWARFKASRISPSAWLTNHIQTLLKLTPNETGPVPAYWYRTMIRRRNYKKNPFEVHWFPHARFYPVKKKKRITIWLPTELKEKAWIILETLGLIWTEFIWCKLEDWSLSQGEYERKLEYWKERWERKNKPRWKIKGNLTAS